MSLRVFLASPLCGRIFKIDKAFHITGRGLCILGEIVNGTVKASMRADLTSIGLTIRPLIASIAIATINREEKISKPGLSLLDVPEFEQNFLRTNAPFSSPISITL